MKPRVLLVEDDADIRVLFGLAFREAGFSVQEATDGLEAIAALQLDIFDAIVLDLSMPRVDGVSALDTFKIMRNGADVPVITVTALDDPAIEKRALEGGAAVFLRKPVTPQQIVDAVREQIAIRGK
ncbi:MAG TPA: response regulator [Abditibacteriaceae bacterium]|jgi:CheY-like chemotaxis protein